MMFEPEMIGAIKIKDGLFIGDELASTVSVAPPLTLRFEGLGICGGQQSDACDKLCRQVDSKSLGADRRSLPYFLLVRPG